MTSGLSDNHNLDEFKTKLRREKREQRGELPATVRTGYDQAIRQHLGCLITDRMARSIAMFWPFDGEPDIAPLFEPLMEDGVELALPVVSGEDDHSMQFHAWQAKSGLITNRYGIPEPRGTATVALSRVDMLVMPLVAYDRHGNRLGMGSGYYDRHLASLRESTAPLRVGVAYSLQEIDPLQNNNWDIPLHGIVNEHGWYTFDN